MNKRTLKFYWEGPVHIHSFRLYTVNNPADLYVEVQLYPLSGLKRRAISKEFMHWAIKEVKKDESWINKDLPHWIKLQSYGFSTTVKDFYKTFRPLNSPPPTPEKYKELFHA